MVSMSSCTGSRIRRQRFSSFGAVRRTDLGDVKNLRGSGSRPARCVEALQWQRPRFLRRRLRPGRRQSALSARSGIGAGRTQRRREDDGVENPLRTFAADTRRRLERRRRFLSPSPRRLLSADKHGLRLSDGRRKSTIISRHRARWASSQSPLLPSLVLLLLRLRQLFIVVASTLRRRPVASSRPRIRSRETGVEAVVWRKTPPSSRHCLCWQSPSRCS